MIVDKIIKFIPVEFEDGDRLKKIILRLKESWLYAPPELHSNIWAQLGVALEDDLGDSDTEWKKRISRIVTENETEEEQKEVVTEYEKYNLH